MGTAIEKYRARMAAKAEAYSSEEQVGGSTITMRGGVLKFNDEELPGNEMLVVILDAVHENTYFEGDFDADAIVPPNCFALGRSDKDMEAHENVPDPDDEGAEDSHFQLQSPTGMCADCPQAQWGSAEKGRGKACSNKRRLAVIPAGRFTHVGKGRSKETQMEVFEELEHFQQAEVAYLKLPVTSVKGWSKYVNQLSREHNAPPFAVLTHIYLEPDPDTQFKVFFDFVETIEDPDILDLMFVRNEEAEAGIMKPYDEPTAEEKEEKSRSPKEGIDGLKKKRRNK